MTNNIMEMYVKITKSFLKNFTKSFFGDKYDDKVSNEYIETYLDARLYNFGDEDKKFFYKRIATSLDNATEEIQEKYPKVDFVLLKDMINMYEYIYYIDGVRQLNNIDEFVKKMCDRRTKDFDLKNIRGLENKFIKMIKEYNDDREKLLKSVETKDFTLDIQKYTLVANTYKVSLDFNFKIPYIYSNKVIDEVYNAGTVNEDKLIIEYTLLTAVCIRDIMDGNFAKRYIVNFAESLIDKTNKRKQTFKILDNLAIQEKVFLKVRYSQFILNKDIFYDLMKDGYKFAIVMDEDFTATIQGIKKLDMFEYIIVSEKSKNYDLIRQNADKIKNKIIYE